MQYVFLVFGIFALIYLLLVFLVSPTGKKHKDLEKIKGRFIAHRGLHDDQFPENSLKAFDEAAKRGYPIEIDLHLTKDGEVVVFHDANLKRMCGSDEKISELTLSQIKSHQLRESEETIPTLSECLETVNGRVPLLIEFKMENGNTKALCKAADQILKKYSGNYLVQSIFPQVVRWYRKNRKDVCRGQLSCRFHKKGPINWLLGNSLLNFIGRPHFVSYKHSDAGNLLFRFSVWLGAFPIGWTFRTGKEVKINGKRFNTWIFENFKPKN